MSRSYKKTGAYPIASCKYSDKWCRSIYHRGERRKVKSICHNVEKWYDRDYEFESLDGKVDILASDFNFCNITNFSYDDVPYDKYMDEVYNPEWRVYYDKYDIEYWWEIEAEKIVMSNIDRSIRFADRWAWTSDGGSRYRESIRSLRKTFDSEVFGITSFRRCEANVWTDYLACKADLDPTRKSYWLVDLVYKTKLVTDWPEAAWRKPYSEREFYWETETKRIKLPYKKYLKASDLPNDGWVKIACIHKYRRSIWDDGYYIGGNFIWFLFNHGIVPQTFEKPEELISWLRYYEEDIIHSYYKYQFHK